MIHFNREGTQMLQHTVSVMRDRMASEDGYGDPDREAVSNLRNMSCYDGSMVVLTGEPLDKADAEQLLRHVVNAELDHWIPDASQRLLYRAARALDMKAYPPLASAKDCGAEPHWHALINDWFAGIYVVRCVTCQRMYRA